MLPYHDCMSVITLPSFGALSMWQPRELPYESRQKHTKWPPPCHIEFTPTPHMCMHVRCALFLTSVRHRRMMHRSLNRPDKKVRPECGAKWTATRGRPASIDPCGEQQRFRTHCCNCGQPSKQRNPCLSCRAMSDCVNKKDAGEWRATGRNNARRRNMCPKCKDCFDYEYH